MYNKDFTDRGNSSVSGFSSTSIYNNYGYNIKTGNRTSLNDLVKHNAILQHMRMFDNENNVNDVFVTSLPTTVTLKKSSIKKIRKRIHPTKGKSIELKVFDKGTKKQDSIIKLPMKEEKINFSALLNNSLTNMGYLKSHDYKTRDIRKLQPHGRKFNSSNIQRFGVYFNEASIPSLINVDNDITQYEDTNKVISTTIKSTTIPSGLINKNFKYDDNVNRDVPSFGDGLSTNLPFTVTDAFEREFDLFTSKEQLNKKDEEIKNESLFISTTTFLPQLESKLLITTTVNSRLPIVRPTKESTPLQILKTEDDRDSYKILTYSKIPQQHLTFVTKSQINGIEENSVKKVVSGGNNIIKLPNILLPSLNDNIKNINTYSNNNEIQRIENTHENNFIDDNHVSNNHKNYAFGSLLQPIMKENYYYDKKKEFSEKPYIFDIPSPVQLPTSKVLSLFPYQVINDPKIQEKVMKLKKSKDSTNMIIGDNLLKYYPNNLYHLNEKKNGDNKKEYSTPIQFGNVLVEKEKPTLIGKSYDKENYHSKLVLKCFEIKEDYFMNTLKSKEKRINISEKECAMFCISHSECLLVAFHRKLKICDLYVIEENKESKRHMVVDDEKKLIQKYSVPFNGVNLLFPSRKDGGVIECIKKIYDEERSISNEEGVVIDSEELEFMDNNIGERRMKEEVNDDYKIKRKALGSTTFIVKSENKVIPQSLIENLNITSTNEELSSFSETLNNDDRFYKSFPVSVSCPNGEQLYYIKSEGHRLGENVSKSTIQRSTLKKCQESCSKNLSLEGYNILCSSFSFNFIKKECHLHEKGSDFEGNNHLVKNNNYNHYESICLQESLADKCKVLSKYPIRKKQKILIGYAIDSFKLSNIQQCIGKCLNNEDCLSITYFHDNEENNCILNTEHSTTDINSFITVQNSNTVDFFSFSNCQKNFPKNMMGVI
uniref:Apple domain-containing protein n=1 Tax=Strongyloides venezuelensis TaxID=75913 RepID=A0A0K0F5J9_STRVS